MELPVTRDDLDTLIRIHQAALYRYARYLGAEPADAEDLVQETFLVACRGGALPEEAGAQAAWLRGVLRHVFLAHCRRRHTAETAVADESLELAERYWTSRFLRDGDGFDYLQALEECLDQLPERQRTAVEMRYWRGKSREQMARELGIGEQGVKMLLRRIRHALARCVSGKLGLDLC